jgi:hypothetical protein
MCCRVIHYFIQKNISCLVVTERMLIYNIRMVIEYLDFMREVLNTDGCGDITYVDTHTIGCLLYFLLFYSVYLSDNFTRNIVQLGA